MSFIICRRFRDVNARLTFLCVFADFHRKSSGPFQTLASTHLQPSLFGDLDLTKHPVLSRVPSRSLSKPQCTTDHPDMTRSQVRGIYARSHDRTAVSHIYALAECQTAPHDRRRLCGNLPTYFITTFPIVQRRICCSQAYNRFVSSRSTTLSATAHTLYTSGTSVYCTRQPHVVMRYQDRAGP